MTAGSYLSRYEPADTNATRTPPCPPPCATHERPHDHPDRCRPAPRPNAAQRPENEQLAHRVRSLFRPALISNAIATLVDGPDLSTPLRRLPEHLGNPTPVHSYLSALTEVLGRSPATDAVVCG
ncbi:hypothetical protein GCM10022254_59210 [Actinomadura meridiana]|uniref:Uncharacterized protein n=1 Tax=Actinomadura meridiana TaxID=559626 RepID=A0ABP8CI77_9ACTN